MIKTNTTYFDNIDNEEKAYFLGMLLADGCNDIPNIGWHDTEEDAFNALQSHQRGVF